MNNSNPFIPQGSLVEQKNKKRARFQVAVLSIFGFNVLLLLGILLIQGCGRSDDKTQNDATGQTQVASGDNQTTAPTAPADTSTAPPVLPPPTASNTTTAATSTAAPGTSVTPPTAPPTIAGTATDYTIEAGDTFALIHKKFNVSVKAIEAANPDVAPTKLKVGNKLHIPAPTMAAASPAGTTVAGAVADDGTYTVKSGDNLSKIATSHGTTVKAIRALNPNVATTDRIKVGDKLKLPGKAASASASAAADASPAVSTVATDSPMTTSTTSTPTR